MGVYANERVNLPEDGFYFKKSNNKTYVYKYTVYYRNKDGKSRNKSSVIGILDEVENKLIPNDNYYKLNDVLPSLSYDSVTRYGFTFLCDYISETLGLKPILNNVFGEHKTTEILALAYYMIHEGTIMTYCDDWLKDAYIPNLNYLITSQKSSDIFASISFDNRKDFFTRWIDKTVEDEQVFYDVTSISSYASNIIEIEMGYNRDKEKLAQINIGMFCSEKTKLPVYYDLYNGSLTDKSNLNPVIKNAKDCGLKNVKLVLDGGFCDQIRIKGLKEQGNLFTVGVPSHLKEAQKLILEHKEPKVLPEKSKIFYGSNINKASNKLKYHAEYCKRIDTEFMGVKGNIMLCFNEALHSDLTAILLKKIEKQEEELEKKVNSKKKASEKSLKKYQRYFNISNDNNVISYQRNYEIIDEEADRNGYFLLFTTDVNASNEDILYFYRAKDADEKLFYQLKVYMEGNRLRIHNENTMEGKVFVIFIALIIRSYLANTLMDYLLKEHISLKKAIYRLSDIKIIKSNNKYRFLKEITKNQREILQEFNTFETIGSSLEGL